MGNIRVGEDVLAYIKQLERRIRILESSSTRRNFTIPADGKFILPNIAGDPASPVDGQLWYNTVTNKIRGYENGGAVDLV